jgi:hypothetical protein
MRFVMAFLLRNRLNQNCVGGGGNYEFVITNEKNKVIYTEQVEEIGQEPNYEKALEVLKN